MRSVPGLPMVSHALRPARPIIAVWTRVLLRMHPDPVDVQILFRRQDALALVALETRSLHAAVVVLGRRVLHDLARLRRGVLAVGTFNVRLVVHDSGVLMEVVQPGEDLVAVGALEAQLVYLIKYTRIRN